jgi:hypothetical protein
MVAPAGKVRGCVFGAADVLVEQHGVDDAHQLHADIEACYQRHRHRFAGDSVDPHELARLFLVDGARQPPLF